MIRKFRVPVIWGLLLLGSTMGVAAAQEEQFERLRERMVSGQLKARGISDASVLAAMARVPRHLFVPARLAKWAYEDYPLPIGSGQTISQPYIVALMSEWAEIKRGDRVLEVGTGSGYQAAVLAELTEAVWTIDIRPELADRAAKQLRALNYPKVRVKAGDGYLGWPEAAPFDAILVTAGATQVPPALAAQLREGGRLVIPVGPDRGLQLLIRFRKSQGVLREEARVPVSFVPLVEPGR